MRMKSCLLVLSLFFLSLSVNGEEYICSGSYDDQSGTITSTFKRTEDGFIGTHLTTSPDLDRPIVENEVYGFLSTKKKYSNGGFTYVVENNLSIGFLKHHYDFLTVHWIEFEDMGYTTRDIYGGKEELRMTNGTLLQEDMNKHVQLGSCTKNE